MQFVNTDDHETIFCPATDQFGALLWHLLRAAKMMKARREEFSEFANEVGRDEIHWWIFNREEDLDLFRNRSASALEAAECLKTEAVKLKAIRPSAYSSLLTALRDFAESHQASSQQLLDYVIWLSERDSLAPSILFTYRVWGTTRLHQRWLEIAGASLQEESQEVRRSLTEVALGLQFPVGMYVFNHELIAAYGDSEDEEDTAEFSESGVLAKTCWGVLEELTSFTEQVRNSLKNILIEIEKCTKWKDLMRSDAFWRKFIAAAAPSQKQEQHWDFKATLEIWQSRPEGRGRDEAKLKFAEQIAAFANADGGVLLVGVSDDRKIIGLASVHDLESRLKFASDTLAEMIDYPRGLVEFHQTIVINAAGEPKLCLVIMVARAMAAVGVRCDNSGRFTYPIRSLTGLSKSSAHDIFRAKVHHKSDSFEFLETLQRFVRDSQT